MALREIFDYFAKKNIKVKLEFYEPHDVGHGLSQKRGRRSGINHVKKVELTERWMCRLVYQLNTEIFYSIEDNSDQILFIKNDI